MLVTVIFLLAVPITTYSTPAVPFYCRRFKGDCSKRRDSICCREENISTTEKVVDIVEEVLKEEKDSLVASPSIIEEVVVAAPNETLAQNNFIIPSTTTKPGRPVPRFCKLLKFDCKKRSNPLCCTDTLKEKVQVKENVKERSESNDSKDIQTELETNNNNASENENEDTIQEKETTNNISLKSFQKKNSLNLSKRKNSYTLQRRSSIFSKRPNLYSQRKSPLCKIVNCSKTHNKKHKCCRQDEKQKEIDKIGTEVSPDLIIRKFLRKKKRLNHTVILEEIQHH